MNPLTITPSATPNPNARKFTLNRLVGADLLNVRSEAQAASQPAAVALLRLPGVTNVFLTADFVTVNKQPEASWETLEPLIIPILRSHFGE